MTTHDNRGTDDGGATITEPAVVAAVVAPVVTPPPPPLTVATATPCGLSTSTPGPAPFRCDRFWGVDVQQPLPSAMLADALPYGLPP
jgi:hypothetical protein